MSATKLTKEVPKSPAPERLPISYLVAIAWLRSEGIKIDFSSYAVEIRGRNLALLFDNLVSQRVAWIREMDDLQAQAILPQEAPVVTKIKVTEMG